MAPTLCPLCQFPTLTEIMIPQSIRTYYHCSQCQLISADPSTIPDSQTEELRYRQHNNGADNQGYVSFLQDFLTPVLPFFDKGGSGLDFGCGPQPVLAELLSRQGFAMSVYDPFFYKTMPTKLFDFITCTETIEHFHHPHTSFVLLFSWLKPGGIFALMTDMWQTRQGLERWYYLRDITHVSLYHLSTMDFIARRYGSMIEYTDNKRITVFRKGED